MSQVAWDLQRFLGFIAHYEDDPSVEHAVKNIFNNINVSLQIKRAQLTRAEWELFLTELKKFVVRKGSTLEKEIAKKESLSAIYDQADRYFQ